MIEAHKTKQSILKDGKATSKAKLVTTIDWLDRSGREHVVGGVQTAILIKPVSAAVNLIST